MGTRRLSILGLTLAMLAFACGSDSDEANASTGEFNTSCGSDSSCVSGLLCSKSGMTKGLCTATCDKDTECSTRFGQATCSDGACVQTCTPGKGGCPASTECNQAGYCTPIQPKKSWTCTIVKEGVCECRATDTPGEMSRCPSEYDAYQSTYPEPQTYDVCCELGGKSMDPSTWNYCVCQKHSALIGAGETCYTRPIANGVSYGPSVEWCPGGDETHYY